MLTTKKLLQFIKTEDDKNYLEHKCDRLNKEIDQFTCRKVGLFTSLPADLSNEVITKVEGLTKASFTV